MPGFFVKKITNDQRGVVPLVMILLVVVIGASGYFVINQLRLSDQGPITLWVREATTSAKQKTASASAKITPKKTTTPAVNSPSPTAKATAQASAATNNSNSSSNNGSNSNNGSTNSTTTPAPTTATTISPTPTPCAQSYSVKITYPIGGESFKVGDKIHITWDATGTFSSFNLTATDPNNIGSVIGSVDDGNARSLDWIANIGTATQEQLKLQIVANKWPKYVGDETVSKNDTGGYFTVSR